MLHPDYLGDALTAKQVAEWRAYTSIRPFGERAADYRAALLAAILVNTHRGKDRKARELSEFLLCDDMRIAQEVAYQDDPTGYFQTFIGGMIR